MIPQAQPGQLGSYAVTGTWDGVEFTRTKEPIPLSLDGSAPTDARLGDQTGAGGELQLRSIPLELQSLAGSPVLNVVYDDGTLQREMDSKYGPNIIRVQSALRHLTFVLVADGGQVAG